MTHLWHSIMSSLYYVSCRILSNISGMTLAITSRMRARNAGSSGTHLAYTRSLTYLHKNKSRVITSGERSCQEMVRHAQFNDPRRCYWRILEQANSSVRMCVGGGILLVHDFRLQIWYTNCSSMPKNASPVVASAKKNGAFILSFIKPHQTFTKGYLRLTLFKGEAFPSPICIRCAD